MSKETLEQAGKVLDEYAKRKSGEAIARALAIIKGEEKLTTFEELKEVISDANSWIDWICEGNKELYDYYSFRLFVKDDEDGMQIYVATGSKVKEIHPKWRDQE